MVLSHVSVCYGCTVWLLGAFYLLTPHPLYLFGDWHCMSIHEMCARVLYPVKVVLGVEGGGG